MSEGTFTSSDDVVFEPIEIDSVNDWPELSPGDTHSSQPFHLVGMFPLPDEPPLSSYENPFTHEMLDPEKVQKGVYI